MTQTKHCLQTKEAEDSQSHVHCTKHMPTSLDMTDKDTRMHISYVKIQRVTSLVATCGQNKITKKVTTYKTYKHKVQSLW